MIIVSGLPRSGTTFVAKLVADLLRTRLCYEPFNAPLSEDYAGRPACPERLAAYLREHERYAHRYIGHNDGPPDPQTDVKIIRTAYILMRDSYPPSGVYKIMFWQWFGIMRELWPDCRIVYVTRRLQSWLASVVRSRNGESTPVYVGVLDQLNNPTWPYGEEKHAPWIALGKAWASEGNADLEPLYVAAAYYRLSLEAQLKALHNEANEFIIVDYEALTANYEVEAARLFAYCGIKAAPHECERLLVQPKRTFGGIRFTPLDLAQVVEDVQNHE